MTARINFSFRVKRIVAARSGYRCSIPTCGRTTIGPDPAGDKFSITGIAAHIFSASPGGPRGRGNLTHEQLASAQNAIWLCANHAKMVDGNRGVSYPPALLLGYKALQEAKIAREMGGIIAPFRWIHQIHIRSSPLFARNTKLHLGKVTLIVGENCSGKTALCEWIAAFGNLDALWRWLPDYHKHCDLDMEVLCYMPEEESVRLTIKSGSIAFSLNNADSPIPPLPLMAIFLKDPCPLRGHRGDEISVRDDIDSICARLGINEVTLRQLLPYVDKEGIGWVRNPRFVEERQEDDDAVRQTLVADFPGGWKKDLPYYIAENDQRTCLLIELAVALARFSSQFVPTILLLDGGMWELQIPVLLELATHLSSPKLLFQTVIVVPNLPSEANRLQWAGWEIVRLRCGRRGTTISQNMA